MADVRGSTAAVDSSTADHPAAGRDRPEPGVELRHHPDPRPGAEDPAASVSDRDLYLIEDVFSRKCVGWRLEQREKDELAADLIEDAVLAERAKPHTLHADGGPWMTSIEV